ncbi:MAG: hypothetical protein C0498_01565 [Anaerolinea sp.]|nr:hypothetical protein [Anaerolinea sp.]
MIDAGIITRDAYRTLIDGGRYGPRRARLIAGDRDLGAFSQDQVGDEGVVLTWRVELDEPYAGDAALAYGHEDGRVVDRMLRVELPAGRLDLELALRYTRTY